MTGDGELIRIELDSDSPIVAALKLEGKLGLTRGYLEALLRDDDWSFVIKLHALLEAAVTHAVTVERDRKRESRANLETSANHHSGARRC